MRVSKQQIRTLVIECLLQRFRNTSELPQITDKTDPINELGLESLDGLAFACALSEKLNYVIPAEINPLVDDQKNKARKVAEIVELISHLLAELREESNVRG